MPTAPGHLAFSLVAAAAFPSGSLSTPVVTSGLVLSVLPDLDVLAFRFGIPYEHILGHRGLSHSACLAIVLAWAAYALCRRLSHEAPPEWPAALFLVICAVAHGLLDAMTDGGLGVAAIAPFSSERFFFPWRPIAVSPIGLRHFLSAGGGLVLMAEGLMVCLLLAPALLIRMALTGRLAAK